MVRHFVDGLEDVGRGRAVLVSGYVGVLIDCALPIPAVGDGVGLGVLVYPIYKDV